MRMLLLTDGAAEAVSIDTVISNAGKVLDFGGTLLDTVVAHPILGFIFAAGLVGVGVGVISAIIGLARRKK